MKAKKRIIILFIICLIVLIGAIAADRINGKEYLIELKYEDVMKKIENKESFVLCLSQTTCQHCADFKPKLKEVAKEYKKELYYIETNLLTEEEATSFKKIISFSGTPTTVFITEGEEKTAANRINGDLSKDKLIKKLKSNGIIK